MRESIMRVLEKRIDPMLMMDKNRETEGDGGYMSSDGGAGEDEGGNSK